MTRSYLVAVVLFLGACGSPSTPATLSRAPHPPPVTTAQPEPTSAPIAEDSARPSSDPPSHPERLPDGLRWMLPDGEEPPLYYQTPSVDMGRAVTVPFTRVPLPETEDIGLIAGTGPTDVWLVSLHSKVVHFDGRRATKLGELCRGNGFEGTIVPMLMRVRANDLLLHGGTHTGSGPAFGAAVVPRSLPTSCDFHYGSYIAAISEQGDDVWQFDHKSIWSLAGTDVPARAARGAPRSRGTVLWVGSKQHAWLAESACEKRDEPCYSYAWEYRGLSWIPRPRVDFAIRKLWVDEWGSLWALGQSRPQHLDSVTFDVVAVFERMDWHRVAVPEGFRVSGMAGRSSHQVWFYGAEHLFLYDGQDMRTVDPPIERIQTMWLEPGGAAWVGGAEPHPTKEHHWIGAAARSAAKVVAP